MKKEVRYMIMVDKSWHVCCVDLKINFEIDWKISKNNNTVFVMLHTLYSSLHFQLHNNFHILQQLFLSHYYSETIIGL